jgi:hypothetical protein
MAGELGFRPDPPHVEEVSSSSRVHNDRPAGERGGSKQHHGYGEKEKRHPGEYLHTIEKAAEASNRELERRKAPYRFCVYEENGRVMIDLVQLDAAGKITKEIKRNITDEDFEKVIEDISSIEGLFLDTTG